MRELTEQEEFWTGRFGDEYISRNSLEIHLGPDITMWAHILKQCSELPKTAFEIGCNIGANLCALKTILPNIHLSAVEINAQAAKIASQNTSAEIYNCSIFDFDDLTTKYDLVFSCGVLIHIAPDLLASAYEKLYTLSKRYILISEYYNPHPIAISYRNHENKLFKRDFAGEILDKFPNTRLVAYNFIYHRDPVFPKDDVTWFLIEKRCEEEN